MLTRHMVEQSPDGPYVESLSLAQGCEDPKWVWNLQEVHGVSLSVMSGNNQDCFSNRNVQRMWVVVRYWGIVCVPYTVWDTHNRCMFPGQLCTYTFHGVIAYLLLHWKKHLHIKLTKVEYCILNHDWLETSCYITNHVCRYEYWIRMNLKTNIYAYI